jgi:hypothetical protein
MVMKWLLGGIALLGIGLVGWHATRGKEETADFAVICFGECKPGDDCLKKGKVIGTPTPGLKLTCCGRCEKGDNYAEKCVKRTC